MSVTKATLVNSFTLDGKGGNPAGVVLNADDLSKSEKLKIAQAVGYSETAFVSKDDEVDFEVSFFTVTDEVDFCGHATLATFSTLFSKNLISAGKYKQRTKAGILSVNVEEDGRVVMEQACPSYLQTFEYDDIAELIGLPFDILSSTQLPIEVISTGLNDVIVPVPLGYLDKLEVDNEKLSEFCDKYDLIGMHAFELNDSDSEFTASCRNFAPLFGIPEESATGSSSGALACYLVKHVFAGEETFDFVFEQGRAMGCASRLSASVKLENGQVSKIEVGGEAKEIGALKVS
ncbi:PhzF family phenazine biosynthesis protein [Pseudoalteromonas phenolica]|uniref:Phenazine biosynthesis protein PhzF family n=1 Tax=Pseudoalteromonas phenolica TaxID=161398 RepID=A0A0S2K8M4_9GAMM|nr:PhzF family phenazine biosynthesis protein [Pseudoalteromonas phenolica]ALO44478.1 Phenazine biosynthesis protein PhzF family [Pseudoalteromonas phenolica]MBE0357499.1 trans-2,3-dihydro-3-hydroxyanthranilate isomerase [Pseudoalteromonas phenolica O-BC30]RXF07234.1 PhzF family phenazine biosynthesis protein [Pseudoalteromonas phenolica O-BC30]